MNLSAREKAPELQQQSRFANLGLPLQAQDLSFARSRLGESLPKRFDLPPAAHEPGQALATDAPISMSISAGRRSRRSLDRLLFPLDLQRFIGSSKYRDNNHAG